MPNLLIRCLCSLLVLCFAGQAAALSATAHRALIESIESPHRLRQDRHRDRFRHPYETLAFFGVMPDMNVVEIWPGAGWYTDILALYLRDKGEFRAAHFSTTSEVPFFIRSREAFSEKLKLHASIFNRVILTEFVPGDVTAAGPVSTADRVLTFRNVHNWMKAGTAEEAFATFFELLKPGGVLGVVEHRAKPGTSIDEMVQSGYVTENHVIALATQAGFVLAGKSETNANPLDKKDHPAGVWTLPPTLRLGDEEREKYQAIGESDRMTLKFVKPEK